MSVHSEVIHLSAAHPLGAGGDRDDDGAEVAAEMFRRLHFVLGAHRLRADERVRARAQATAHCKGPADWLTITGGYTRRALLAIAYIIRDPVMTYLEVVNGS